MSRWIDADVLIKEIKQDIADDGLTERYVFYHINEAPHIDIVFCKKCKHHFYDELNDCKMCYIHEYGEIWEDDDYCSYGEREGE